MLLSPAHDDHRWGFPHTLEGRTHRVSTYALPFMPAHPGAGGPDWGGEGERAPGEAPGGLPATRLSA